MERIKKLIDDKISNVNDDSTINDVGYYLRMIDVVDRDISAIQHELHERLFPLRHRCTQKLGIVCDHIPTESDEYLGVRGKLLQQLRCNAATGEQRCFLCPKCHLHIHIDKKDIKP